ncbi:DUF896 domain-containing protein [Youngiibacter multivorans]|uniref:Uncharacterized protein YnzC (UPF0291/DUF896 family) n=1 Tax=Youngiibacter multivorans TaxID=937251 RepID=A0ABS4G1M8_9CLOT|nr:DUF896 domain-containing protein [Youngiibacter multivorans]MBP1918446.1 uncharacterized protein YnzC (UPF0291/DUF896 family) [Youngiibacter multivorans]
MEHDELVAKINEYSRIARERDLTLEETVEREKLRREYIDRVKGNLKGSLEGIERKK